MKNKDLELAFEIFIESIQKVIESKKEKTK